MFSKDSPMMLSRLPVCTRLNPASNKILVLLVETNVQLPELPLPKTEIFNDTADHPVSDHFPFWQNSRITNLSMRELLEQYR